MSKDLIDRLRQSAMVTKRIEDEAADMIESLRQQLASMTADRDDCLTLAKLNFAKNEESQKQLAAAIAECKLKDEALQNCEDMLDDLRDYPI